MKRIEFLIVKYHQETVGTSYPKSGGCRGNVPSYGFQLLDGQQG